MAAIRELYLTSIFILFSQISGQQSGVNTIKKCGPSNLDIVFNFSLGGENFFDRSWYLNSTANKIAAVNSTGFLTVEPPYSSRLTLSGTNGITLSHVISSDSGSYLFIIVTDTSFTFLTATTTVIINETPNNSCIPVIASNNANSFTCKIPAACPGKDNIQAKWTGGSIDVLTCTSQITKYNCCAVGDPVTNCYNGSLCTEAECKAVTTTETETTQTLPPMTAPSQAYKSTKGNQLGTSPSATTSKPKESVKDDKKLVIIISVSVGGTVLGGSVIIIIYRHRRGQKKPVDILKLDIEPKMH